MRYEHTKLSRDEQDELAVRAKGGDIEARNQLIEGHLPWIVEIVTRYRGNSKTPISDLVHVAVIAICKRLKSYDPSLGAFSTWLWKPVAQAVAEESRADRIIAFPRRQRAADDRELRQKASGVFSLNKDIRGIEGRQAHTAIASSDESVIDAVERRELIAAVRRCIDKLPEKLRVVMQDSLYREMTGAAIGRKFKISKDVVHKRKQKALVSIRKCLAGHMEN